MIQNPITLDAGKLGIDHLRRVTVKSFWFRQYPITLPCACPIHPFVAGLFLIIFRSIFVILPKLQKYRMSISKTGQQNPSPHPLAWKMKRVNLGSSIQSNCWRAYSSPCFRRQGSPIPRAFALWIQSPCSRVTVILHNTD